MRVYEELFIVKPDVPEEEVNVFIDQLKVLLTTGTGTIDKIDNWGIRKLAYRVSKFAEGRYILIQFSSSPEAVKEIERRLRVTDMVIKFITVRIDEKQKKIDKRKKAREKRAARRPAPAVAAPAAPLGVPGAPVEHAAAPGLPGPAHPMPAAPAPAPPAAPETVAPAEAVPEAAEETKG